MELPKEPTLIENLDPDDYYGIPIQKAVSTSIVSTFAREPSPLHFYKKVLAPDAPAKKYSLALVQGSKFHELCEIGEEEFYKKYVVIPKSVKKGDSRFLEIIAENQGKKPLFEKTIGPVLAWYKAISKSPLFNKVMKNAKNEVSFFWKYNDFQMKGRADIWIPEINLLVDLKTTYNANPFTKDGFQNSIEMWKYHWQAYTYCKGLETVLNKKPGSIRYAILCVEKEFPFEVCAYEITKEQMARAKEEMTPYLDKLVECLKTGNWGDGYGSRFHTKSSIGQYGLEDDILTLLQRI